MEMSVTPGLAYKAVASSTVGSSPSTFRPEVNKEIEYKNLRARHKNKSAQLK